MPDPEDFDYEKVELRMIDFPDGLLIKGTYTLEIVRMEREGDILVVYARFAELENNAH